MKSFIQENTRENVIWKWRPFCLGLSVIIDSRWPQVIMATFYVWTSKLSEGYIFRFCSLGQTPKHDDVIKWKHFPRYWPFVRGIHWSPVNSPHKGQWRRALMFSLICAWINGWVNNRKAGDFRRHRTHYYVSVMVFWSTLLVSIGAGDDLSPVRLKAILWNNRHRHRHQYRQQRTIWHGAQSLI